MRLLREAIHKEKPVKVGIVPTRGGSGGIASGSKAKDREKERAKVGNNNGQLRITMPPRVAHAKRPGPILLPLPTFLEEGWNNSNFDRFFMDGIPDCCLSSQLSS